MIEFLGSVPLVDNPVDIDTSVKDQINWGMVGGLAIVSIMIVAIVSRILAWLKAGAPIILTVAVVIVIFMILAGGSVNFNGP